MKGRGGDPPTAPLGSQLARPPGSRLPAPPATLPLLLPLFPRLKSPKSRRFIATPPRQPQPRRAGGSGCIPVPAAASLLGHSHPVPALGRGSLSPPASGSSFQAARSDRGRRHRLRASPRSRPRLPGRRFPCSATGAQQDEGDGGRLSPPVHKGPVMAPRAPQRDPAGGRERGGEERGKAFFSPLSLPV